MSIYEQVNFPADLKKLTVPQLEQLAAEIRENIISTVNVRGGHLASNLGVVDITLALHYVFDCPEDKFVFDTGHQAYAHKIVTGRKEVFSRLRCDDGISGFERKSESVYDAYSGGHSGNSLSIGLGLLRAKKMNGEKGKVISIIGDGALTSGIAYEALNDIGAGGDNLIIVLNDNKMSISKNVGAMSKYLGKLRMSSRYANFKSLVKKFCYAMPFVGDKFVTLADNTKDGIKSLLIGNSLFESIGIKYYGPFDGHDIKTLIDVFSAAKEQKRPVLLHVLTDKGRGYKYAEENPREFHGVSPSKKTNLCSFAGVFGSKLCKMADKNEKIVAITAAMTDGVGLREFSESHKDRFFDVGIAEQHATDLAAGMASGGLKPYFSVYSSFLQRAVDQVIVDVCIDNLPVTIVVDHAGFVSGDGITHQGIFDLSVLGAVPNLTICSPMDGEHLEKLLDFSESFDAPLAIRYTKAFAENLQNVDKRVEVGKWNYVKQEKNDVLIIVHDADSLHESLKTEGADIVFATFVKPFDQEFLHNINYSKVIVVENNAISGGLGESIAAYLQKINKNTCLKIIGFDQFVDVYSQNKCFSFFGLSGEKLNNTIKNG